MFGNSDVASIDATELGELPAEAQAFHRRARIVDAAVREIAEHGYDQVAEEAIAERAGVTRRVFYDTFAGKEEALMWAYDVAAAYAIPQILRALRAEARLGARGRRRADDLPGDPGLRPRLGAGLPARRAGRRSSALGPRATSSAPRSSMRWPRGRRCRRPVASMSRRC